jgi:hypothetical protein
MRIGRRVAAVKGMSVAIGELNMRMGRRGVGMRGSCWVGCEAQKRGETCGAVVSLAVVLLLEVLLLLLLLLLV